MKISKNLAIMVSLDGFQFENDNIRGKGSFIKIIDNINLIMDLKRKGIFKGELSVNCVISEKMAGKLYDFMKYFENKGINTLYFCFPWYISKNTSIKMDNYFEDNFKGLFSYTRNYNTLNSWHSYSYKLDESVLPALKEEIGKIHSCKWNIRIRFQPALEIDEIEGFIGDSEKPAQGKKSCLAIATRLNVMASSKVTVCKLFPEFVVGDLKRQDLKEIWHSEKFRLFRKKLGSELMPVCSKCILLYLHGI